MTKGTQSTATTMTLTVDPTAWQEVVDMRGWKTMAEIGRAIGVTRSTVDRILSGKQPPTAEFLAGIQHYVPQARYRRMFPAVPATKTNGRDTE